MLKTYEILDVIHSGRKGIRGTKVTNNKYNNLIGSQILLDIDDIGQFKCMCFLFKNHPRYDYWTTSEVLKVMLNKDSGILRVETVNTIYIFHKLLED